MTTDSDSKVAADPTVLPGAPEPTPKATLIRGNVGTGKTEALIDRIAATLDAGADPADILALSAGIGAADTLRDRLTARLGSAAETIRVTTLREAALNILDCPDAHAATGRRAVLLSDFELNFFLEDMRVTGLKQKRLREMLKFFFRGWTELAEDDDGWLITEEERDVNAFAKRILGDMEALHPAEVNTLALRFLRDDGARMKAAQSAHVFVDDYTAANRAGQMLANLLARDSICIAADPVAVLQGDDPYPFAGGVGEFTTVNRDHETVELTVSTQSRTCFDALSGIMAQECMSDETTATPAADAVPGSFEHLETVKSDDECEAVAAKVKEAVDGGMAPEKIFVAVPNGAWRCRVLKELRAAGVPASAISARQPLGGDIRDYTSSAAAQAFTAVHLAAQPNSNAAWRCWCGFGDYLTCSAGFADLAKSAVADRPLLERIEQLDAGKVGGVLEAEKIRSRYEVGKTMLAGADGLTGTRLLEALCSAVEGADGIPGALMSLVGPVADDDTAAVLYERGSEKLLKPTFTAGSVHVAGFDTLIGQDVDMVVLAGFVNGFTPSRSYFDLSEVTLEGQQKMHRELVRRLYCIVGKAHERLVVSTFTRAGLEDAERMKMKIGRIRLENGVRMCVTEPSIGLAMMQGEIVTP